MRACAIELAGANVPVVGVKIDAAFVSQESAQVSPPAIRTFPSSRSDASWETPGVGDVPGVRVKDVPSKISALVGIANEDVMPPTSNTRPSGKRIALW